MTTEHVTQANLQSLEAQVHFLLLENQTLAAQIPPQLREEGAENGAAERKSGKEAEGSEGKRRRLKVRRLVIVT